VPDGSQARRADEDRNVNSKVRAMPISRILDFDIRDLLESSLSILFLRDR
jgi:hypothetical protein